MKKSSRNGFSLVELLIVIGIIGLLVGLVGPAILGARVKGAQTKDQANLRGIGQMFAMYMSKNGWPKGQDPKNPGVGTLLGAGWVVCLYNPEKEGFNKPEIFKSPSTSNFIIVHSASDKSTTKEEIQCNYAGWNHTQTSCRIEQAGNRAIIGNSDNAGLGTDWDLAQWLLTDNSVQTKEWGEKWFATTGNNKKSTSEIELAEEGQWIGTTWEGEYIVNPDPSQDPGQ